MWWSLSFGLWDTTSHIFCQFTDTTIHYRESSWWQSFTFLVPGSPGSAVCYSLSSSGISVFSAQPKASHSICWTISNVQIPEAGTAMMRRQQSVSKSIPNDLEDADGKLRPCKAAIHKGQMFLRVPGSGRAYRLAEYHWIKTENRIHWRIPPCATMCTLG